jgi:hypothetical protein
MRSFSRSKHWSSPVMIRRRACLAIEKEGGNYSPSYYFLPFWSFLAVSFFFVVFFVAQHPIMTHLPTKPLYEMVNVVNSYVD